MPVDLLSDGRLSCPARLAALSQVGLLDTPPEPAFDRLTTLAKRTLTVPIVLISLVDDHRQFFKSMAGLTGSLAERRGTPLSHSFCQNVVIESRPFVVEDAGHHPIVCSNGAFLEYDVVAYLGVPLITEEGHVLGAFCAIDNKPRQWTEEDREILCEFAQLTINEICLRRALNRAESAEEELRARTIQLEKYAENMQTFLSVASHDLQEPVRKILQFGSILRRHQEKIPVESQEYLDKMILAGKRMQNILSALLSYSRVATRQMPFRPVNLGNIVQETLESIETQLRTHHITVTCNGLPVVNGDPVQLRQVFEHLIDNAVKFRRPDVSSTLLIRGENRSICGRQFCEVTIKDNGIGFEPEFAERIFGVFERLHSQDRFPGTGIGLAICRRIIELHQGTITGTATIGEGATFTILLPLSVSNRVENFAGNTENKTNARITHSGPGVRQPPLRFTTAQNDSGDGSEPGTGSPSNTEER